MGDSTFVFDQLIKKNRNENKSKTPDVAEDLDGYLSIYHSFPVPVRTAVIVSSPLPKNIHSYHLLSALDDVYWCTVVGFTDQKNYWQQIFKIERKCRPDYQIQFRLG